jgi:hypothetical protein
LRLGFEVLELLLFFGELGRDRVPLCLVLLALLIEEDAAADLANREHARGDVEPVRGLLALGHLDLRVESHLLFSQAGLLLGSAAGLGLGDTDPLLPLFAIVLFLSEASLLRFLAADPLLFLASLALGVFFGATLRVFLGSDFVLDLLNPLGFEVLELFERDQG